MAIPAETVKQIYRQNPADAWRFIIAQVLEKLSLPLEPATAASEVFSREQAMGEIDNFLATTGWDLWQVFGNTEISGIPHTADKLVQWWESPGYGAASGKAILILDGLSLRELPWLLQGAQERGFQIHGVSATASEMPGETNEFARALGFNSRSQLQNNGAGQAHRLVNTKTETVDMPWQDCISLVDASPNWVFWHHWPDSKLHDGAGAGQGLEGLTKNVVEQLTSDDFWAFVTRLAHGRRLVITSDHGYAATGQFADAEQAPAQFLKETFSSGRSKAGSSDAEYPCGPFVPPVALQVNSPHGEYRLALGRRKWKNQGGYPTLAHGGLSLLEVLSPFVEITK